MSEVSDLSVESVGSFFWSVGSFSLGVGFLGLAIVCEKHNGDNTDIG